MAVDSNTETNPIETEVIKFLDEERDLQAQETALAANPEFKSFLERQKSHQEASDLLWANVLREMDINAIKSIKGAWGSISLAERSTFTVSDVESLPPEFVKMVADVKAIGDEYKLTGELPGGVEERKTRYLVKRFK